MIDKQQPSAGITSNTTLEKYRSEIHRIPGTPDGDAYLAKQYETATDPIFKMLASLEINERGRIRSAMRAAKAQQQPQQGPLTEEKLQALKAATQEDQMLADQEEMANTGIAQLPIAPGMFEEAEGMAAGGIVAFDNGGKVSDRWKALANDTTPYLAEDFRRDAAAFFDPIVGFLTNREGRERIKARELKKAQDMQTADQPGDFPMYTPKPVKAATTTAATTSGETPSSGTKAVKAAEKVAEKVAEDPYEELKRLFREDKEARDLSRKEARDMALLETGLSIMGGSSPHAFENIGKGGAAGAKAYQERLAGLRKEDRDRARDYADIVSKQQEAGFKKEDIGLRKEALDVQRLLANKAPGEIALVDRYAKSKGISFDEAVREVYGAKRKEDQIAAMVMDKISKGEKIDRTSLAKNLDKWQSDYGITPTR